ncbi:MAG: dihydroorotate dehydrogenase [Euryarchaeota archaeon]|nr:dihydroorotate dehydrogenase [Euryarchaeota archaeon]
MVNTSTTLAGLRLRSPTVLASGILDETGSAMHRAARSGAGAVVTKSIGAKPRVGYANPSCIELDGVGVLNAVGLPNPGVENVAQELWAAARGGVPVIASVFGGTPEEFSEVGGMMAGYGAQAIELNLSCPHAKGYGTEIGTDPALVTEVVRAVKQRVRLPVFAKLAPNVPDIAGLAKAAVAAGADGITAINTVKAMAIDVRAGRPILANRVGGLSGRAIKPVGLRAVYEIAQEVDAPIMGVGGVYTGEDALEYIMAGASAVQVGSAVMERGWDVFAKIDSELKALLDECGYPSVEAARRVAVTAK